MESIQHSSHSQHPLFLIKFGENENENEKEKEEEEEEFVCYGCLEQITKKDNVYACQDLKCYYFLHEKCADLPRERMKGIQHISHFYHPLILKKFGENEEEKEEFECDGCLEQITEKDNYYACQAKYCRYYIHKKCADLPREINLPCHLHPLTLFASFPDYRLIECDMCQRRDWKGFGYHCSLCEFEIDLNCSSLLLEGKKNNLQHEAHPHPLAFNLRSSSFKCDACYTKHEDLSYFCTTCNFWIHKSCAFAPKSITVSHHDDPLFLAYSLPEQHRNFEQFCEICEEKVLPSKWVYYCDNCRYFTHLKCATLTTGESEIQDEEGDTESSQLMQFPFPNCESVPDPLSLFVANKIASVAYDDGPTEISHRLHHHPISICYDAHITTENDMICDGCVRPISAPFYSCSKCNFFLHKFCAELPEELQCPLSCWRPIKVKSKSCYDLFQCSFCLRSCNGFLCKCTFCDLEFDIGCASNLLLIPSRIKHDSHGQHPLVRSDLHGPSLICNACNRKTYTTYSSYVYSCKACSFNLCNDCANSPGSVRHEYDRHSIPLTYPPIKDHPSDFICEICEEDINPRYWMYHCKDCNQSFHTRCLSPFDRYSNVKFGGKVNIDNIHKHPLTFVRNIKSGNASLCGQCGVDYNGVPILECEPCGFKLCKSCAIDFEA